MDNDSVNGEPGRFVTYAEIGYGVTSAVFELGEIVKYDSRSISATIRSIESNEKDMAYKRTM
jgi:hypothetical protein